MVHVIRGENHDDGDGDNGDGDGDDYVGGMTELCYERLSWRYISTLSH